MFDVRYYKCKKSPVSEETGEKIFNLTVGKEYAVFSHNWDEIVEDPEFEVIDENKKKQIFFDLSRIFEYAE